MEVRHTGHLFRGPGVSGSLADRHWLLDPQMSQVTHSETMLPLGCSQRLTVHGRGTRARPFMPQAGLLSWISLLGNSPLAFLRPALYPVLSFLSFLMLFLPNPPSCSLSFQRDQNPITV